ncbi:hypothetical protein RUM43_000847 [Polyplax serrata]|uniref:TBC1 domain family member 7 n=1 Tax=Polyplax serrata TaxID=468196 RepID=A0AAN8SD30_POLSC
MATDERNFRSFYYEKVGFRSVEEKKSLEILLKEKPLDKIKLKQFCLRFAVPGVYRNLLWKLLLNVTPRYSDNVDFVSRQRTEVYEELYHALQVMNLITSETPKPHLFLLMWLLETGQLKLNLKSQLDDDMFKGLIEISRSLLNIFTDDVDIYWISKGFYTAVKNMHESIPKVIDATKVVLEREDKILYRHLNEIEAFDKVQISKWLNCLFAGALNEIALVKIWDKIVGGSFKILAFVAVVIFLTLRRSIMQSNSTEPLMEELKNISEDTSEVIVNKATELWQQYGSPLVVGDSRKEKIESSAANLSAN